MVSHERHQQMFFQVILTCSCGERFCTNIYGDADGVLEWDAQAAADSVQIRHAVHEAEKTWVQGSA